MAGILSRFASGSVVLSALAGAAHAVCPVCIVAVASVLGVTRDLGVNDLITGLWYGALVVSSIMWMQDWSAKKGFAIPYRDATIAIVFLAMFLGFLYWPLNVIGASCPKVFGFLDSFLFGAAVGIAVFLAAVRADKWLREANAGKILVYYQKVWIPVILLAYSSVVFWFLIELCILG